jgi:biopolymer transport protein ExbB/TolQ
MEIGSILVERFFERRNIKVDIPDLLKTMQGTDLEEIRNQIITSNLLARHKETLIKLLDNRNLQSSAGQALASQLLSEQETRCNKTLSITDFLARLAPMLGLAGTLIPLGPGLIALGQGDIKMLASSLLVAFDSTIAGLVIAGIAFVISRWRKIWYEKDMAILETLTEGLLGGMYGESISK